MRCNHNYIYDNPRFYVCTKCRHRSYSRIKRKSTSKKGISIITAGTILGVLILAHLGGIIEVNDEKIGEIFENTLPDASTSPIIVKAEKNIENIIAKITEKAIPETSSKKYAMHAINYINEKRNQYGTDPITHDSRVYNLALARVQDMHEFKYLDHTNPDTGTCPYNMKSDYGLKSHENVAENAFLFGTETHPTTHNPDHTAIIDGWMDSTGHRINLLSYEHVAGSVACYGGFCVFLGLNHGLYGEGCYTAAEGMAYASRFENCSSEQMAQYDVMQQEYDMFPKVITDMTQYYRANDLYDKINDFAC